MTTFAWPANWGVSAFSMRVKPNTRTFIGPYTSTVQTLDLTGEKWVASIETTPGIDPDVAGAQEAFFDRLRGPVHRIALWNLKRPVPRGTLRDGVPISVVNTALSPLTVVNGTGAPLTVIGGTPMLSASVARGASLLPVSHVPGRTVNAGDMVGVGIGGQLVRAMANAVFDGAGNATIEVNPRMRNDVPVGTVLVWDKPTANFMLQSDGVPVVHRPGMREGSSVELMEAP